MSGEHNQEIILAIPTYRPNDIAKTVGLYAANFMKFGHQIPISVFDDSNEAGALASKDGLRFISQSLRGKQPILYVGPLEKRAYLTQLKEKFGSGNADTIDKIFRPSYGGNRNFILAYTVGKKFVSVDDDMRPEGIFLGNRQDDKGIISRGSFIPEDEARNITPQQQDIMKGYLKFIGITAGKHRRIIRGYDVQDSNVDSQYGNTTGNLDASIVTATNGEVPDSAVIKIVQTHLTGDGDIDSEDLVNIFMDTGSVDILSGHLPKKYVIESCSEAVTSNNARLTGALLGYDNTEGGIYFLPTKFRCEDFIWRVHLENRNDIASAYTEHAQTHARSLSVRNSIARDWFNELISQIVKKTIRDSVDETGSHSMTFHNPEPVSLETAAEIENKVREKQKQAAKKAEKLTAPLEFGPYLQFEREMNTILNDDIYSTEAFAARLTRIIENEFKLFNKTAELWPSILEYSTETANNLPMVDITREIIRGTSCEKCF